MERNYPKIQITDKAARSLRSGHPWVYADEVLQADAACVDGQIVDVTTRSGHWLGAGFYNSASKIRVRVLSRNANDRFDEAFWARRIRYAVDYRRTVIGQDFDNCRLIFGEADGFPGLTVDRFGQILVAQVLSLGMELRKQQLFALLLQTLHADGAQIDAIYERNDVKLRQKEGMEQGTGFVTLDGLRTDLDGHVTIRENGILVMTQGEEADLHSRLTPERFQDFRPGQRDFFLRLMGLLDIRQEDCAPEVLANLVFSCLLIYNSAPESMPFLFPSHLEETAALHVKFLVNYLGSLRNAKKDR